VPRGWGSRVGANSLKERLVDGSYREGDLKARVLEATDIVDLVGRSVALKRRGKDFLGLCPFHQEKTPSFTVSQAKQFFYCYGCKKHGNAIDFVIERDRVEFKDALVQLAIAANIPVGESAGGGPRSSEMQILRDAHAAACMYFEKQLAHPTSGAAARDYLKNRGFNEESIKRFRIGLAPEGWDLFLTSAAAKKFTPAQLALAGLVKPREQGGGFYDTFRNRLMFPIRDSEGRVIAFGGRVMPGGEDKAKYLNSPQTPLFDKGRCAFGLDLAKEKILQTRSVAVVEGYTDVVMAHQFGCTDVVSTLGTALTPRHLALLARYADRIVLLFDPDAAGDAAVDRAVELFLSQDKLDISVAQLPDGLDPDEFLLKRGAAGEASAAAAFNEVIAAATDALAYKWKQLIRRFSQHANDLTGQQKAVQEYLSLLSGARAAGPIDSLRWGAALNRVSRLTQIPAEELHRRFKTRPNRQKAQAAAFAQPKASFLTANDRAEAFILGYLLCEPSHWAHVQRDVQPDDFADGPRRRLAQAYWQHQQDEGEPVLSEFLTVLEDPAVKELAAQLAQGARNDPDPLISLPACLKYLLAERQKRQRLSRFDGLDEVAGLAELTESARIPDPRRLPVPYGI
jgi:DNA primase